MQIECRAAAGREPQTGGIQNRPAGQYAPCAPLIRQHAGQGLRQPPDQVLQRDGQGERLARQLQIIDDGSQEYPEGLADPQRQGDHQRSAKQQDEELPSAHRPRSRAIAR